MDSEATNRKPRIPQGNGYNCLQPSRFYLELPLSPSYLYFLLASLPEQPKMAAGVGDRDPLLRLRRHLREEVEPQALLLQPPPGGAAESTNVEKKEKPLPRLNIHSAFWILASIAVTYYVEFFKTIKETIQADRNSSACFWKIYLRLKEVNTFNQGWLTVPLRVRERELKCKKGDRCQRLKSWCIVLGSCLLAASLAIAFYCIIYLEWYCGIEDYDAQYPVLIPVTTATFIAAAVCFNIALWPVWSFLTPLLLFTQFMGVVMLVSLLG
ncbi:transmembrane protein 128 isoform X2 [Chelonoidis abingdonii]|uniref:transmembrane protein 128 isoform X2 n=1 Tax=Chelonoidis abingdonii TaxID=106734 RepID=UPI0013F18BA9|nr:transmembrane protein 128 isoform X2 [Chelonoidis abingdonii]